MTCASVGVVTDGAQLVSAVSPYPCCRERYTNFRVRTDLDNERTTVGERTCPVCATIYEVTTVYDGEKVTCEWRIVQRIVETAPVATTEAFI